MSILKLLADQLDILPGFDPDKSSRGMLSQLLGMNKPQTNPSGVPPIMPQDQMSAPGGANPFQQFAKPRGAFARMLTPNSYDRQYDAGHQNFLVEQGKRFDAQQAQAASQRANQQFVTNAQAGGFSPEEVARMQMARNANPEEFGKSFAGNFGFNTAGEGDMFSRFGGDMEKVDKTPTPTDPAKLAIDQQNANSNALTAQAAMHRAKNPGSMVSVHTGDGVDTRPVAAAPSQGYQQFWDDEAQEWVEKPIRGGKVDRADENRQTRAERAGGTVIQDLGRALTLAEKEGVEGEIAGGPAFGLTKWVPGMPAWEVNQHLQSALSNIGIDQLQAMRDASPTGGALGQIPVQQQKRLEQMLGSLDPQAPDHVLENNIKRAMNIYLDIIHGQGEGPERFDLNFDNLGRPLAPRPEGVTQDEWIHMDPEERALFQ